MVPLEPEQGEREIHVDGWSCVACQSLSKLRRCPWTGAAAIRNWSPSGLRRTSKLAFESLMGNNQKWDIGHIYGEIDQINILKIMGTSFSWLEEVLQI